MRNAKQLFPLHDQGYYSCVLANKVQIRLKLISMMHALGVKTTTFAKRRACYIFVWFQYTYNMTHLLY